MNKFLLLCAGIALIAGCTPDREVVDIIKGDPGAPGIPGAPGADGKDGASCFASETEDGLVISCGEGSEFVIYHGKDGAPGANCSVEPVDDGVSITCGDSESIIVYNGSNGTSCTASPATNGVNITCGTNLPVFIANGSNGTSCSASPATGGANITCGTNPPVFIANGTNTNKGVTLVPITISTSCKGTDTYPDIPAMTNKWIKKDGSKVTIHNDNSCSQGTNLFLTLDSAQTANGSSSYWFSPTVLGFNDNSGNLNLLKF